MSFELCNFTSSKLHTTNCQHIFYMLNNLERYLEDKEKTLKITCNIFPLSTLANVYRYPALY